MKNDYTHIAIILDRTGSMETIRNDTIGGFNAFLNEQKDQPGKATLTLVQFDSQDPYEIVHSFEDIKKVPDLTRETFVPRARTPLLDAMGRGINDLESNLSELNEDKRPERVVMVFITDGQENASREFRKDQIQKMIKEKQEKADWQFVFLSADLGGINDAMEVGFRRASVMSFAKDSTGTAAAWKSASKSISEYRMARKKEVSFTDEDQEHMDSDKT